MDIENIQYDIFDQEEDLDEYFYILVCIRNDGNGYDLKYGIAMDIKHRLLDKYCALDERSMKNYTHFYIVSIIKLNSSVSKESFFKNNVPYTCKALKD